MRSSFDKLLSAFGFVAAAILLIGGVMLTWASTFIGDQVYDQLSQQDITMPAGQSLDSLPPADKAALEEFAGQPMTSGPAAKAYADHYILAHMNAGSTELAETVGAMGVDTSAWELPLTYQSAGSVSRAIAADESLSDSVKEEATTAVNDFRSETLFKGSTLRGLLLYGYAFATMGTIAGWAAIGCYVAGGIMLILAALGLWHSKRAEKKEAAGGGTASGVAPPTPVAAG